MDGKLTLGLRRHRYLKVLAVVGARLEAPTTSRTVNAVLFIHAMLKQPIMA
jgi:hypothetical protein